MIKKRLSGTQTCFLILRMSLCRRLRANYTRSSAGGTWALPSSSTVSGVLSRSRSSCRRRKPRTQSRSCSWASSRSSHQQKRTTTRWGR